MSSPSIKNAGQSLGNIITHRPDAAGLSGETTFGKFRIIVYTDSLCRVSITRDDGFADFSYSVIAQPQKNNFKLEDHDDRILLRTSRFHLTISKNPVGFHLPIRRDWF